MYGAGVRPATADARRLLERGVRFVQVWTGPASRGTTTTTSRSSHRQLAGEWDRRSPRSWPTSSSAACSTSTLVIWGGEFGRTPGGCRACPAAQRPRPQPLRLHACGWPAAASKGGHVHGATDEFGFAAVENKVHVHDLHATMLHLLGFDHEKLTYRYAGRDFRLTDVHGRVIKELSGVSYFSDSK